MNDLGDAIRALSSAWDRLLDVEPTDDDSAPVAAEAAWDEVAKALEVLEGVWADYRRMTST